MATDATVLVAYDCPVCHFYKNTQPGPCRRIGCSGTAVERRYIAEDALLTDAFLAIIGKAAWNADPEHFEETDYRVLREAIRSAATDA